MDNVLEHIKKAAVKHGIDKVVLFGSRARGDASQVSDYDIAVFAKELTAIDRARFCEVVDEIPTLKKIDVVFIDSGTAEGLIESINKDGVVVYEKEGNKTCQFQ